MTTLTTITEFPRYSVSKDGQVWSDKSQKLLTPQPNGNGYQQVTLFNGDGRKYGHKKLVHVLVWETFNGPIPKGLELDHIDRDPSNNFISNLRLTTSAGNKYNTVNKGASWSAKRNCYLARIYINGKRKHLGSFKNYDDAHAVYEAARIQQMHTILSGV